jgi:hypothetical protein
MIIPQKDGRSMWRFKRFLPGAYFRMLKKHRRFTQRS